MLRSNRKFFDILKRNGISTELETMTVTMHRTVSGGKETVIFQGVGKPIPAEILRAINEEVIPLLEFEQLAGYKYETTISSEVLELGEPARRQASFAACMSNLDG